MDTFDDLWEQAEINQRALVAAGAATGFVAGFAMSTQPVQAQTMIVTARAASRSPKTWASGTLATIGRISSKVFNCVTSPYSATARLHPRPIIAGRLGAHAGVVQK